MHFTYKYINHDVEKLQEYIDFLFFEVWMKADGDFDSSKLKSNPDLKRIYEELHHSDSKWANFFNSHIERIYQEFLKISRKDRKQLQNWYKCSNDIEKLCRNKKKVPVTYNDLETKHPELKKLLKKFYMKLYGKESPFNLVVFGDLKKMKEDHYQKFIEINFDGHEGPCPFCGLNDIMGNDHSHLEAYDHYLPKSVYPFSSINFRNLAPTCNQCNSYYKKEKKLIENFDPLSKKEVRRKAFYPYSKYDWKVLFEINLSHGDIDRLTKKEVKIHMTCEGKEEEIESWEEVYGLKERYVAKVLNQKKGKTWFAQVADGIHNARKTMGNPDLTYTQWYNQKLNETKEDSLADHNFLKEAFLKECYRIGAFDNYFKKENKNSGCLTFFRSDQ